MLRVTCTHCHHEFDSSIVNPGKVSYKGCNSVFQLEFSIKIPCPYCKSILGLLPVSPQHAKGIPTKEYARISQEKTQYTSVDKINAATKKTAFTANAEKTTVRPQSQQATKVKPFKVLPDAAKKPESLRIQINKEHKVIASNVVTFPPKKVAVKPVKFLIYAASALLVSSFTALTMFSLKSTFLNRGDEVAMESLSDEDSNEEGPNSQLAAGGPTEDLVVDQAEENNSDQFVPSKYKKNILFLPELKRMSSGFGIRLDPFTRKMAFHGGVDFKGKVGDDVAVSMDGTVVHAGPRGRYGKIVIVSHGHGLETRYAHLSRVTVKKGQNVRKGDIVGKIGNTGRSTGPHLHLEVIKNGQKVNPLTAKLN